MQEALQSNREDTSVILKELGEISSLNNQLIIELKLLSDQIAYYKNKCKISSIVNPILGITFGSGLTMGIIGTIMNFSGKPNHYYKVGYSIAGASLVIYSGGIIFKVW